MSASISATAMQASLASRLLRLVTLSLSLSLALPLTVPSKTGVQYPQNFISKIIAERTDPNGPVTMRFPPEPNGFLHLGHAKSICVNFGLNEQFNEDNVMRTNVRMDDTNPLKEVSEGRMIAVENRRRQRVPCFPFIF